MTTVPRRNAARFEADYANWETARALDAKAEMRLRDSVAPEVIDQALKALRKTFHPPTPYPRRAVLRGLAQQHVPAAYTIYRQGDGSWWEFATRHRAFLQQIAQQHASRSGVDASTVLSTLWEAAYRAAIGWDPLRGAYTTALVFWAGSLWQRAPDRQTVVNSAESRGWGTASVTSLDAVVPRQPGHSGIEERYLDRLEAAQSTMPSVEPRDAARAWQLLAALPARHRHVLIQCIGEGKTRPEVGAELGYTREWVRQIELEALVALRLKLRVRARDCARGAHRSPK